MTGLTGLTGKPGTAGIAGIAGMTGKPRNFRPLHPHSYTRVTRCSGLKIWQAVSCNCFAVSALIF